MGFLDSLFGRTRLPKSNEDKLFAMSNAAIGPGASDRDAGVVVPVSPSGGCRRAASTRPRRTSTTCSSCRARAKSLTLEDKTDDLGFDWLIASGTDFEEAIAAIHSAATSLLEEALATFLAVAFRFEREGRPE